MKRFVLLFTVVLALGVFSQVGTAAACSYSDSQSETVSNVGCTLTFNVLHKAALHVGNAEPRFKVHARGTWKCKAYFSTRELDCFRGTSYILWVEK